VPGLSTIQVHTTRKEAMSKVRLLMITLVVIITSLVPVVTVLAEGAKGGG
jgi:uncharacterized membrane protein